MKQVRQILFYKQYFEEFFSQQTEKVKDESAPITLKRRKPRSDVLSLPKQHREHRGTQSIDIQNFKLSKTYWICASVAKKDFSEWTQ